MRDGSVGNKVLYKHEDLSLYPITHINFGNISSPIIGRMAIARSLETIYQPFFLNYIQVLKKMEGNYRRYVLSTYGIFMTNVCTYIHVYTHIHMYSEEDIGESKL